MKVTNVTVRYDRSRQPAKYESAEAMVEFTATLEATVSTDDDYHATAVALLGEAKTIVLTELGLVAAGSSASAHAALPAAAAPAATPAAPADKPAAAATGTRRKTDKVAPAAPATAVAAAPAKPAEAAVGDIPVEPAAKPAETALGRALPEAKAAAIGDIPVEAGPAKTAPVAASPAQVTHAGGDELTPGAVQKYITSKLVAKAFLPNVVLGVLKNDYKVDRVFDLPADKLAEFYAKIKKLAGE